MNVLIFYCTSDKKIRKTIDDSLFCFERYDQKNKYYFFNMAEYDVTCKLCSAGGILAGIDTMIFHYSALAMRYNPSSWDRVKIQIIPFVRAFKGTKIAIPQDEYSYTGRLQEFIKEAEIDTVLTCSNEEDYEKLYPASLGYKKIDTVFTGYVDEVTLAAVNEKASNSGVRHTDVGYRARKLPYWLGKHGQLKVELADVFLDYLENHDTGLVYDIANTADRNAKVFLGNDWINYLLDCRTMLGCLGGSGLVDYDGTLVTNVDNYVLKHPEASFEEVEEACFPGKDNYIHLFALSPRHFECAITRTCQLLVEGNYQGVFKPGVDYIEIKRDFSNIGEIIEKIKDVDYCKQIAENCYRNVIESGKYTYAGFVDKVISFATLNDDCSLKATETNLLLVKMCRFSQKIPFFNIFMLKESISAVGFKTTVKISKYRLVGMILAFVEKLLRPLENTGFYKRMIHFYRKRIRKYLIK